MTEAVILHAHRKATIQRIRESGELIILSVQDTTMLNYASHLQTEGLGEFGSGPNQKGLIVHSAIAVTPKGIALCYFSEITSDYWINRYGLAHLRNAAKPPRGVTDRLKKRKAIMEFHRTLKFPKWLRSMTNCQLKMPKSIRLVHVGDREADIYEFFDHAIGNGYEFLVRVAQNRATTEACRLFDKAKQAPAAGQIVVSIPRVFFASRISPVLQSTFPQGGVGNFRVIAVGSQELCC